jgi:hypothetical protein
MGLHVYEIKFKLYAESQAEADALQTELMEFVNDKREQRIAVTASKLIKALRQFGNTILVNNYLKL